MTEYLKVDEQGFNGYFEGLPKGDITMITGELDNMLLLWAESIRVDSMAIYSDYRTTRSLNERYNTVVEDYSNIDKHIEEKDMVVIESDTVENHREIYDKITEENTALLVISANPSNRLKADASAIFEEMTKVRNMVEVESKFIIRKHMYLSLQDRDRVFYISYRPEPYVDDDIQHG